MDTPQSGSPMSMGLAAFNTVLSMCSGFIAFISIGDVQAFGGILATLVAIVSGVFAIRYWRYAIIEKKQTIELNKTKQNDNVH